MREAQCPLFLMPTRKQAQLIPLLGILLAGQAFAAMGLKEELEQRKAELAPEPMVRHPFLGMVYYVSERFGDDARTEVQATGSATPWKSLARLSKVALHPGDAVLLHAGDTFPGTLLIKAKGTPEQPILIAAYGVGAAPVLTGEQVITGWTSSGPGRWKAPCPHLFPMRLQVPGTVTHLARYPRHGWFSIDSVVAPDHFRLRDSLPPGAREGIACVHFVPWCFAYQWMKPLEANDVLLDAAPVFGNNIGVSASFMRRGCPVVFLNLPGMVEQEGDWAWDRERGELVFESKQAPHDVRADMTDYGILLQQAAQVVVQGLRFTGYRSAGAKLFNCRNVVLEDLSFDSTGAVGIDVQGGRHVELRRCRVRGALDKGISLHADSSLVEACQVGQIGLDPAVLLPFLSDTVRRSSRNLTMGNGIECYGHTNAIRRNLVEEVGYDGIFFSGKDNLVEQNMIVDFCQTLNDGGAIYTGGKASQGSVIRKNVVGYIHTPAKKGWTHGIYLDDLSEGYLVDSNRIENVQLGVMLHNARENRVIANEIHAPWRDPSPC